MQNKIEKLFEELHVLKEGHFLLTSGKHSAKYMQCAKIFEYPNKCREICLELINKIKNVGAKIDVVIGPAVGAVLMAYEVARQLNVRNIFAERVNGKMILKRNFSIEKGDNVLIVEDVTTTGGSINEIIKLVKECGAKLVGIGSVVDRTNGRIKFKAPFEAVLSLNIESYDPSQCPLCKKNIPIIKPGSRLD